MWTGIKTIAADIVAPRQHRDGAGSDGGEEYQSEDDARVSVRHAILHVSEDGNDPAAHPTTHPTPGDWDALRAAHAALLTDNAALEQAVKELETENAALAARSKSLEEEGRLLQGKIDQLTTAVPRDGGQLIASLEAKLAEQSRELAQVTAARDAARRFSSQDRAALLESQKKITSLETRVAELDALTANRAAQIDPSEAVTASLQKMEQENLSMQARAAELQGERDAALAEVSKLRAEARDAELRWRTTVSDLPGENRRLLERVDKGIQSDDHTADTGQLHAEVDRLTASNSDLRGKVNALMQQLDRLSQDLRGASSDLEEARRKERLLHERANEAETLRTQLVELQRKTQAETLARRHTETAAATAAQTIQELSAELKRLRQVSITVQSLCNDTLEQSGRKPSASPTTTADETPALTALHRLVAEFLNTMEALREAQRVLQQWEATYIQARDVNSSLSKQVETDRRTIKELKEELALKSAALDRLSGSANQSSSKLNDQQLELNKLHAQVQSEKRRVEEAERRVDEVLTKLHDAEEVKRHFEQELCVLKQQEDDRETELVEARTSVANMEKVLAAFQAQKAADIDERTRYLSFELEEARSQLAAQVSLVAQTKTEAEAQVRAAKREVAQKSNTIATLQTKLGDLRVALEQTMLKINDSQMIDKRIVSHLMINYVASVRSRRGDDMDIVRVMSGLLNWDADAMRKVGLVDDPNNAKDASASSSSGGSVVLGWGKSLLSTIGGATPHRKAPSQDNHEGNGSTAASLAQLWVDFLIKESDGQLKDKPAEQPQGAAGSHPPTAAPETMIEDESPPPLPPLSAPPRKADRHP